MKLFQFNSSYFKNLDILKTSPDVCYINQEDNLKIKGRHSVFIFTKKMPKPVMQTAEGSCAMLFVCNSDVFCWLMKCEDSPFFILQIKWRRRMSVCSRANDNTSFMFLTWAQICDHGTTIVNHWSANVLLWQLPFMSNALRKIFVLIVFILCKGDPFLTLPILSFWHISSTRFSSTCLDGNSFL